MSAEHNYESKQPTKTVLFALHQIASHVRNCVHMSDSLQIRQLINTHL